MNVMLALGLAIIFDALIGDPQYIYNKVKHPVTWMAKLLMCGEGYLNKPEYSLLAKRTLGLILISTCSAIVFFLFYIIQNAVLETVIPELLVGLIASIFLAFRSLLEHVNDVKHALAESDLENSRKLLAKIVGRDTTNLSPNGVSRALIETLSENFSDGFVAPVFWFLIAGLPGIATYKMINTADSMIGNRSERFLHFGWATAKVDDFVNFIPARVTAALLAFAALITRKGKFSNGIKTAFKYSNLHASPNAGWPEAMMAGLLNVKLGGPRAYSNGNIKDAVWLGKGSTATIKHIKKAITITSFAWLSIISGLVLGISYAQI